MLMCHKIKLWRGLPLVMILTPIVVLTFYRPARALVPEINDVVCMDNICIDDESRLNDAKALSEHAQTEVEGLLGPFSYKPKFIFCSSQDCYEAFGFNIASAQTIGILATVVGPRGWKDYYLRHELIHQWQVDYLGAYTEFRLPEWLSEGMAYELGHDPREKLTEPWHGYRERFRVWYDHCDRQKLPEEIMNTF